MEKRYAKLAAQHLARGVMDEYLSHNFIVWNSHGGRANSMLNNARIQCIFLLNTIIGTSRLNIYQKLMEIQSGRLSLIWEKRVFSQKKYYYYTFQTIFLDFFKQKVLLAIVFHIFAGPFKKTLDLSQIFFYKYIHSFKILFSIQSQYVISHILWLDTEYEKTYSSSKKIQK